MLSVTIIFWAEFTLKTQKNSRPLPRPPVKVSPQLSSPLDAGNAAFPVLWSPGMARPLLLFTTNTTT